MTADAKHPIQPMVIDDQGTLRFKKNLFVRHLLDSFQGGLNQLARLSYPREDYVQLMQLIGYSLGGFGELSCVTDEDYEAAEKEVIDFKGVRLADSRKNRIYIAGPMSGIPEHNFPAFNAAAESLRAAGWHVENPADHGAIEGAEWSDYLRYDIACLATCEAIALLPGWHKSKGACLEFSLAGSLGMRFFHRENKEWVES